MMTEEISPLIDDPTEIDRLRADLKDTLNSVRWRANDLRTVFAALDVVMSAAEMPPVEDIKAAEKMYLAVQAHVSKTGRLLRHLRAMSQDHYTPVISDEDMLHDLAEQQWFQNRDDAA